MLASVMPTSCWYASPAGHAEELDLRLVDFNGGTLRNAIPREAFATLAVAADKVDALKALVSTYQEILKTSWQQREKSGTAAGYRL